MGSFEADLARYEFAESRKAAEEAAFEDYRQSHDITDGMSGGEAKQWVRATCELVDVCHDDDTELGRQIRRLVEAQFKADFQDADH